MSSVWAKCPFSLSTSLFLCFIMSFSYCFIFCYLFYVLLPRFFLLIVCHIMPFDLFSWFCVCVYFYLPSFISSSFPHSLLLFFLFGPLCLLFIPFFRGGICVFYFCFSYLSSISSVISPFASFSFHSPFFYTLCLSISVLPWLCVCACSAKRNNRVPRTSVCICFHGNRFMSHKLKAFHQ